MTLRQPPSRPLRASSYDKSGQNPLLVVNDTEEQQRRNPSGSVSSHDGLDDDFNSASTLVRPPAAAVSNAYASASQNSLATPTSSFRRRRRSMRDRLKGQGRRTISDSPLNDSECPSSASSRHPSVSSSASPVANRKRNQDFHELFRSVPSDERLIDDCSCALQRDIILAGRFYISENHVCFTSNIFGFVTTLVFAFSEIVAIDKEMTAMVFPNAISLQTQNSRNTFRSFISRDVTYDLLMSVWHANRDTKKALPPVSPLHTSDSDISDGSEAASLSGSDGEASYNSSDEDSSQDSGSASCCPDVPLVCVQSVSSNPDTAPPPKVISNNLLPASDSATTISPSTSYFTAQGTQEDSQLGPTEHPPTEFLDPSARYDRVIKQTTIAAPLSQVYSLLYGPNSVTFLSAFLSQNQKVQDLQMDDADETDGLCPSATTRTISYIKPLNGVVGPKQTRCILTDTLDYYDLEKAVAVTSSTQTPDVPSGNVFCVKNKVLLTWAENNTTNFLATGTVEWSGRSFFKGLIEKGSSDGQLAYMEDLIPALSDDLTKSPNCSHTPSPHSKQGRRKRKQGRMPTARSAGGIKSLRSRRRGESTQTDYGLRGTGPISLLFNIIKYILATLKTLLFLPSVGRGGMLLLGIVLTIASLAVLRHMETSPQLSSTQRDNLLDSARDRFYMYETMWKHQESELWDWLEERLGSKKNPFYASFGRRWSNSNKADSQDEHCATPQWQAESGRREKVLDDRQIEHEIQIALARLHELQSERDRRQQTPS